VVRIELGGSSWRTEAWRGGKGQKMELGSGSKRTDQRQGIGIKAMRIELGGGSRQQRLGLAVVVGGSQQTEERLGGAEVKNQRQKMELGEDL